MWKDVEGLNASHSLAAVVANVLIIKNMKQVSVGRDSVRGWAFCVCGKQTAARARAHTHTHTHTSVQNSVVTLGQ